jgi:hypothetical protein
VKKYYKTIFFEVVQKGRIVENTMALKKMSTSLDPGSMLPHVEKGTSQRSFN